MALFNTQTIFNLLITLIIGVALYYYIRFKFRVLELTQREHAKVLQNVIMSMNNPRGPLQNLNEMKAGEMPGYGELSNVNHDHERHQHQHQHVNNNELIDVSDEDDDDEDESDTDSSGSSETDNGSDSEEEYEEEEDHSTKKIIIGGTIESQTIEHLTGPDIKVIELSHPLYPSQNVDNEHNEDNDDDDDDDEDDADDDDDDDDDSSENGNGNSNGDGDNTVTIKEVTSTLDGVEYLENLEDTEHKLETSTGHENENIESDEISIKAVFKTKESDTHAHNDFNGMNVQSLRQLYKQRLSAEGKNMSEAAIGKLTKKELIKNLQQ